MFAFQVVSEQLKRTHLRTHAGTNKTMLDGKDKLLKRWFICYCRQQHSPMSDSIVTRNVHAFDSIDSFIVAHLGAVLGANFFAWLHFLFRNALCQLTTMLVNSLLGL